MPFISSRPAPRQYGFHTSCIASPGRSLDSSMTGLATRGTREEARGETEYPHCMLGRAPHWGLAVGRVAPDLGRLWIRGTPVPTAGAPPGPTARLGVAGLRNSVLAGAEA